MSKDKKKFIDIVQLFKSKNPSLLKWIPKFLINYLKRIIHEEDINNFMAINDQLTALEFCEAAAVEFGVTVEVVGLENIPKTGGAILAANHPLGGFDALTLVPAIFKIRNDIKFIVNDLLLSFHQLKEIFEGVNKHGKNAQESLQKVDELFASEKLICLFPAGMVSRKINGQIIDLEWKKTFVTRSKKYKIDVIPVYIEGSMSNFFYRLSNLRKFLGIKANIEMLYLSDEMYKQQGKKVKIIIGKPIPYQTFTKEKSDIKWAADVKEKVYNLNPSLSK